MLTTISLIYLFLNTLSETKLNMGPLKHIHTNTHSHRLNQRSPLTVLFSLGQLHKFLLFQCVHHICKASFAALWRPECEAHDVLPPIPGTLLWLMWRGRVGPVGIHWAVFIALIVLGKSQYREIRGFWFHFPSAGLAGVTCPQDKFSSGFCYRKKMGITVLDLSVISGPVVSLHYISLKGLVLLLNLLLYC